MNWEDCDVVLEIEQRLDAALLPLKFRKHPRGVIPHAQYNKDWPGFGICVEASIEVPPPFRCIGIDKLPDAFMDDPPIQLVASLHRRHKTQGAALIVPFADIQPHSKVVDKVELAVGAMHLLSRLGENDEFFQFVMGAADEVAGPNDEGYEVHVLRLGALIDKE